MTQQHNEPARRSRWPYVLNLVALIVLALAAVIGVNIVGHLYHHRFDLTTGGQHTLSSQTKALLKKIDQKDEHFELANAMPLPAHATPEQLEQYQKVQDLLQTYANTSSSVTVLNAQSADLLPLKIAQRYAEQAKPYEAALQQFTELAPELKTLFEEQALAANTFARQTKLPPNGLLFMQQVSQAFSKTFPQGVDDALETLSALRSRSTLTPYSAMTDQARSTLETLATNLSRLTDPQQMAVYPPQVTAYLKSQQEPLDKFVHEKIEPLLKTLAALKPLESEKLINQLPGADVVVLGPQKVSVISANDVFAQPAPDPSNPTAPAPAEFQGEQAISSALLAQAMPDKPVVVFVTPAPQPPNQLYSVIMQRLTQANFNVETWAAGQAGAAPPAEGKGVVWIVLPGPPQSPQQMMMGMGQPNTAPIHAALTKHLAAGGCALFLAEAQSTPMYGRGPTGYPYADLLKPFGIDVASNYVVVQRYSVSDQERVIPQLTLKRYPETPITKPLQSLPMLLAGFDMHTAAPTVVRPAATPPAGAHPELLLEAKGPDVWGESSALGAPEFDKTSDLAAPVPLGVMSTGPHDARVVVIGNAIFASNEALNLQTPVMTAGGTIYMVPNYPGNAELVLNSVYWLAGYDNMIAVSPRASAALRIRDIPPSTLMALDWGVLWAGAPLLLLVIGGVVYAFRR